MNHTKKNQILFVDDDQEWLEMLILHASADGWEVFTARNALTAMTIMENQSLDLICLDVQMPTANGLEIAEMAAATGATARVPLVVLTGQTDTETKLRCAELNARFVAKGNETWPRLKSVLDELRSGEEEVADQEGVDQSPLSATELIFQMIGVSPDYLNLSEAANEADAAADQPWVLCIEDDHDFSLALKLRMQQQGISVLRAFNGTDGLKAAISRPADAIILDYNLPNGRGDFVLRSLKSNPVTCSIPVIVVSGQKRNGLEREMLHLGAERFFAKPVRFDELLGELKRFIPVGAVST